MAWTVEQLTFMNWQITPHSLRTPATQKELAEQLGVHETTLSRWNDIPGWTEARNKAVWYRVQKKMPDIVNALVEDLTSPEGWQARRDFIRYGLPYLTKADQEGYFDELKQADVSLLPQTTIQRELEALPPEDRSRFIEILSRLGHLQEGSTPDADVLIYANPVIQVELDPSLVNSNPPIDVRVAKPGQKYDPSRGNRKRRPNTPR